MADPIQAVPTPGSGAHAHGGESHVASDPHHVHVVPMKILVGVFALLLVLTILTVAVTMIDFGRTANVWLALGIAVAKAAAVALYFMHLRWDSPFNGLILISALFFVALFIGVVVLDAKEYYINYQPPITQAPQ